MSRPLSSVTRQAAFGAETGEAFIVLLTLTHAQLPVPLRVAGNGADITSRGNVYSAYPFEITLPDDNDARPPRARLVIDNVDRQILLALRNMNTPPQVMIEVIRVSAPDTPEAVFADFRLSHVTYDSQRITGDLGIEDFTAEPFPANVFCPSLFPSIF